MKTKTVALVVLAAVTFAAGWLGWRRLHAPPRMNPPVAIQDQATIDFSSGKPVVKDSTQEKAIIDAAVKEMDDAAKGVVFKANVPAAAPAVAAPPTK